MSDYTPIEGSIPAVGWGDPQKTRAADFANSQQVEGYAQGLSSPAGAALLACARFSWVPSGHQWRSPRDHRGSLALVDMKAPQQNFVEWRTASAPASAETTFTFVAGSSVLPEHTYPEPAARLFVDGTYVLTFPLGRRQLLKVNTDAAALEFVPLRYIAPVENSIHRQGLEIGSVSGLYRINLPADAVRAGEPVTLRVELDAVPDEVTAWFFVQPRQDALALSVQTLSQEVRRLQTDLIQLKETVDRIGRQLNPELHPERIRGERFVVTMHPSRHVHPPNLTRLKNGDLLVSFREASEHISDDGISVQLRSTDNGRTWGDRTVMFAHPYTDARQNPITQLRDGTLLSPALIDPNYSADRTWDFQDEIYPGYRGRLPSIYMLRSEDNGHSWQEIAGPIAIPNHLLEVSKQMVLLPDGRPLMAMAYKDDEGSGTIRNQVLISDDRGVTWRQQGATPVVLEPITGEPAIARCPSGRLVMLMRSEMETTGHYYQTDSEDDGVTWTPPHAVPLPSMSAPAHLLVLNDGRLLCSYGTRIEPRSIYLCLSNDEGRTWEVASRRVLADDMTNLDGAYPTTVQLPDGELITLWYDCVFGQYAILGCRYRLDQ